MIDDSATGITPILSQVAAIPKDSPNLFAVLNSSEAILEEVRLWQIEVNELVSEENIVSKDLTDPYFSAPPLEGGSPLSSPVDTSSPPSYADIARKKHGASSGSSKDDSFEPKKTAGRNSKKEIKGRGG